MNRRKARTTAEVLAIGMAQAQEVGNCLEWQGAMTNKGTQPCVKVWNPEKGHTENVSAPRLLWEAKHGPIPEGRWVFRKCCNNLCVRMEHLAMGTRNDHLDARKKAGTTKHKPTTIIAMTQAARKRATAVNTAGQVARVRELLCAGVKRSEVAAETGVSLAVVHDIGQGRRWRATSSPWAGLGAR